jgi:glyoxylase-like metal-dependent hydrolase (beta-lactamase superfamily II)
VLGDWTLHSVSGGRFRVDGGTMFGVVPRAVWQKLQPPDDSNRIRNATNCVLARNARHTVLIDTGYGGKCGQREREYMALESGEPILTSLAAIDVDPDDINLVVLSHLHFDHAGGATTATHDDTLEPTFRRARYIVQRTEWEDAISGAPELRNAYPAPWLLPLAEHKRLELIEGDVEILPGLRAIVTGGHTRGHQAILIESRGETAFYLGDLCPMTTHVRSLWGMSYDMYPLEVRRRKPELLGQAADNGWWVLWDHDPDVAVSKIQRDAEREFQITEARLML